MKHNRSFVMILLMCLLLLCSGCASDNTEQQPETVSAAVPEDAEILASGTDWTLYDNGLFVFTGSEMPYISDHEDVAWYPYMEQIREVVIEKPVTFVSQFAFQNCVSLERVTMPEGVQKICLSAFEGCTALRSVQLPTSLTEIEFWAFSGSGLEEIVLPAMPKLSNYVFQNCSALRSVVVSEGTNEIGFDVFEGCNNLESIYLPESLTAVGVYTFRGRDRLTDVFYGGTADGWAAVDVGDDNDPLLSAQLHVGASPDDLIS